MRSAAHLRRTELGADPSGGPGEVLATIVQLSDLHLVDVASPTRFEWVDLLADDPRWRPLLHMHRPQESLVPWAVGAHVEAIRADPTGPVHGRPIDLVLATGDNLDNAQHNELDAYLALIAGGAATLGARGGPQDAAGAAGPWPYWSPLPGVVDAWKPRGYPVVEDFFERTAQPLVSPGLGLRWSSLPGNHDVMCQGTAPLNAALRAAALGATKGLLPPPGLRPDDPLALFVDRPELFLGAGARAVAPDPRRRPVTAGEWLAAHLAAGAAGYTAESVAAARADTVIDLGEVAVVLLDTNHPAGDYQGSVGAEQLAWLDRRLTAIDRDGRLALLASHHGSTSLVNTRGGDPERRLADALLSVVHRHRCVVGWLAGHRHVHHVAARPGAAGGLWEITTGSLIDWPVERSTIEVVRHRDGTLELISTVADAAPASGSLAELHRSLAARFAGESRTMAGAPPDRDVRLLLAPR